MIACAFVCVHRVVQLARDYATRRTAFGKLLKDHPLHIQTLARMEVSGRGAEQTTQTISNSASFPSRLTACRHNGQVETRGAFLLVMDVCRLLGREESGVATRHDAHLLRLLTPVAKLYTGKQVTSLRRCCSTLSVLMATLTACFVLGQAVAVVSEGLESFGGQGYIEDTGLPGLLRDAQVRSIFIYSFYSFFLF